MWRILFIMQIVGILGEENSTSQFTTNKSQKRIVGGTLSNIASFPNLVMFLNSDHICGGTILNMRVILTAAHCIEDLDDTRRMLVRGGTSRLLSRDSHDFKVLHFIMHQEYDKQIAFQCDIALLLLSENIKYSNVMKKANLPTHNYWQSNRETQFVVAGWGSLEQGSGAASLDLLSATLRYVDAAVCSRMNYNIQLSIDMFCLYGDGQRDSCQGDSGGGVLWNGYIVGLVSFGEGCAMKNRPGVYSNVYYHRGWIQNSVKYLENIYCRSIGK